MLPSVSPVVGRPMTLTCHGEMSGDVIYEFSRDSTVLQSGSSDTLELPSASTSDSGVYQCTATMVDSGDVVTSGSVTVGVIGKFKIMFSFFWKPPFYFQIYQRKTDY